jgi:nucleoside 2-deoxyribosyltransferase
MKKAYLAIGMLSRKLRSAEIETIRTVLAAGGYSLFIFVDTYHFSPAEEKQMMAAAFREIRASDLLIAEVSEKAIGVGIEMGYAAASGKPVLYLRHISAAHSTTAAGTANETLIYSNAAELSHKLSGWLAAQIPGSGH